MMNNPKVHRYYTQTMKRGEVMAGSEGRVVEGGLAWLLLPRLTDSGCQSSKVLFIYLLLVCLRDGEGQAMCLLPSFVM